ncbi:hypothetical protein [uncultured Acinetobacter sp.]|uniref:hypothetical protein n=1 Tax=uncultured Acinetobacter sp. TaxID=165433 RepID=UPI00258CEFC1|nr:hypothetical protein [uncultured Acinetobacter sp.]
MEKQLGILVFLSLFVITGCSAKSVEKDAVLKLKVERCGVILPFLIDLISRKLKSLSLFKFRWFTIN